MRFICQAVPKRSPHVEKMRKTIPNLEVHYDRYRDPVGAFIKSLRMSHNEPHVHLEDDIIFCSGFTAKVKAAILQHPKSVISFFIHSQNTWHFLQRVRPGIFGPDRFIGTQAFYLPAGAAFSLADSIRTTQHLWENPLWFDNGVIYWLRETGLQFLIWYPSLVQHLDAESMVGNNRLRTRYFVP